MSMKKLAINDGKPIRTTPYPNPYDIIGEDEKKAVMKVLDGGVLSGFLGSWSPKFYGGEWVQKLEREWSEYFGVKHSISVNSATSGLYAAVGAAGISPGDEVIVSPYSMSASATAPLIYGGIPVFADIDPDTFCLSPDSIRENITSKTSAIIVVDLFGHPAEMDEIMEIADENDLVVIEDAAQACGAKYKGKYAGTLGHIGVFSLNVHKIIQTGEGGVVVTENEDYVERLQLIRNHGEAVVKKKGVENIVNIVGFNNRMTEIEAAIASEQLKKLSAFIKIRQNIASKLSERLSGIKGLTVPELKSEIYHGYYVYPIKYDSKFHAIHRDRIVSALVQEGIPISQGYVEPLYLQPLYQKGIAFGSSGYPFTHYNVDVKKQYRKGICPVTEKMYNDILMTTDICNSNVNQTDVEDFIAAFEKVFNNLGELNI